MNKLFQEFVAYWHTSGAWRHMTIEEFIRGYFKYHENTVIPPEA